MYLEVIDLNDAYNKSALEVLVDIIIIIISICQVIKSRAHATYKYLVKPESIIKSIYIL